MVFGWIGLRKRHSVARRRDTLLERGGEVTAETRADILLHQRAGGITQVFRFLRDYHLQKPVIGMFGGYKFVSAKYNWTVFGK